MIGLRLGIAQFPRPKNGLSRFHAGVIWAIKANGVLVILPTAVLGILLGAALEVLVLFFLVISGLPGP